MAGATHKALSQTALFWLYAKGCSVYAMEVPTRNGIADALGIMTRQGKEKVYYIEAKASRSDLICEKQKAVYERSINGHLKKRCDYHATAFKDLWGEAERDEYGSACGECVMRQKNAYNLGIDYYYIIVADGVKVEPELYPEWGVINQKGEVVRRAKKMPRPETYSHALYLEAIAHVLVYKAYGKFYLGEFKETQP